MVSASAGEVWAWLSDVPDPEIPAVSVTELGIVRDVQCAEDGSVAVMITPTYSGCPAMQVIADGIEQALREHGVQKLSIATQLSPAWTTDWISEAGRAKLRDYGIAPPAQQAIDISALGWHDEAGVACPRCGSDHTRLVSRFGSTACKALYRCADCLEPFDYFKPL